jgi:hypothetical protein
MTNDDEIEMIGRSTMNCILQEEEDEQRACDVDEEFIQGELRKIRLLFDAMDNQNIRRINFDVFSAILSTFYDDNKLMEQLANDDDFQIDFFESYLVEAIEEDERDFEFGLPEDEVPCNRECKNATEVIKYERNINRRSESDWISYTVTHRPNNCIYKNYL